LKSGTFGVPGLVLPGHGTAWDKSGTSGTGDNSTANLLNQFNSHLVPCPGNFNGYWEKEVSTSKITILGGLIGSRFIGCGSWTACGVM